MLCVNFVLALVIIFIQRKDPRSVWAWLILLYGLPIAGFCLYLLFGTDVYKRRHFESKGFRERKAEQERHCKMPLLWKKPISMDIDSRYYSLMKYNFDKESAVLTDNNSITVLSEGLEKFATLFEDLRNAKEFIHLQYYIMRNDFLFAELAEILKEKRKEGVAVRILYDRMGCGYRVKRKLMNLEKYGIESADFFPLRFGGLPLRINYRNHRKIAVIDGKVGYIGGFNIGKEYLGLNKKLGHWRDTHLRVEGSAVVSLSHQFALDWNYAKKEDLFEQEKLFEDTDNEAAGNVRVQIISGGPDKASSLIRDSYLKMMMTATESIDIQTPYFIPDESILNVLKIAAGSGVQVRIMVPSRPDHPFVYWANYSYLGELLRAGAKCYQYMDGFLHSKGIVVDKEAYCYGTANMDIRSFFLNFEINAIVLGKKEVAKMQELFEADISKCRVLSLEEYDKRGLFIRIKERISRMLSPIL